MGRRLVQHERHAVAHHHRQPTPGVAVQRASAAPGVVDGQRPPAPVAVGHHRDIAAVDLVGEHHVRQVGAQRRRRPGAGSRPPAGGRRRRPGSGSGRRTARRHAAVAGRDHRADGPRCGAGRHGREDRPVWPCEPRTAQSGAWHGLTPRRSAWAGAGSAWTRWSGAWRARSVVFGSGARLSRIPRPTDASSPTGTPPSRRSTPVAAPDAEHRSRRASLRDPAHEPSARTRTSEPDRTRRRGDHRGRRGHGSHGRHRWARRRRRPGPATRRAAWHQGWAFGGFLVLFSAGWC